MAWKASELVAKHQIVGILKDAKPIMPGTRFECKDEATEKQLLKAKAAEIAEPFQAPDVVKSDIPAPRAATASKPRTTTVKKPAAKSGDSDKDLV